MLLLLNNIIHFAITVSFKAWASKFVWAGLVSLWVVIGVHFETKTWQPWSVVPFQRCSDWGTILARASLRPLAGVTRDSAAWRQLQHRTAHSPFFSSAFDRRGPFARWDSFWNGCTHEGSLEKKGRRLVERIHREKRRCSRNPRRKKSDPTPHLTTRQHQARDKR